MKKIPRQYSRAKRKEQVLLQFGIWHGNGDTEPKTMNRIAKALGLIPAYKVTLLLLELVEEGKLGFVDREKSGRWKARAFYSTIQNVITEKYHKRRVSVKRKGVVTAQLEMWS